MKKYAEILGNVVFVVAVFVGLIYFWGFATAIAGISVSISIFLGLKLRGMILDQETNREMFSNLFGSGLMTVCKESVSEIRTMDYWTQDLNDETRFAYTMAIIIIKALDEVVTKESLGFALDGSTDEFIKKAENFFQPIRIIENEDIKNTPSALVINSKSGYSVVIDVIGQEE